MFCTKQMTQSFKIHLSERNIVLEKSEHYAYYRLVGLMLQACGGILLAWRSLIDGRVSLYGMVFKILSFVVTALTIFCDPQLTKSAKFSYGIPKLFGLGISLFTFAGIVRNHVDVHQIP